LTVKDLVDMLSVRLRDPGKARFMEFEYVDAVAEAISIVEFKSRLFYDLLSVNVSTNPTETNITDPAKYYYDVIRVYAPLKKIEFTEMDYFYVKNQMYPEKSFPYFGKRITPNGIMLVVSGVLGTVVINALYYHSQVYLRGQYPGGTDNVISNDALLEDVMDTATKILVSRNANSYLVSNPEEVLKKKNEDTTTGNQPSNQ